MQDTVSHTVDWSKGIEPFSVISAVIHITVLYQSSRSNMLSFVLTGLIRRNFTSLSFKLI